MLQFKGTAHRITLFFSCLIFFSFLFPFSAVSETYSLPPDAKKMLDSLPGKAVTLGVVISRALAHSEGFKQIQSQAALAENPRLELNAALDWQMLIKGEWSDIANEQATPFAPQDLATLKYSFGLAKAFVTGTSMQTEFWTNRMEQKFSGALAASIPERYFESKLSISVAQKLWKNAFGRGTRKALSAANVKERALLLRVQEQGEAYVSGLIGQFYGAWLAQKNVSSAIENTKRRTRLNQVMAIKVKRGTAEEPDRLQVQSALRSATSQEAEARQSLKDRWYALVLMLKLPRFFLQIDPLHIPLSLESPLANAKGLCANKQNSQFEPTQLKRARKEAEAALLQVEATRADVNPDLELQGGLVANGIHLDHRMSSMSEATALKHEGWIVGLQLKMPFNFYAENLKTRSAMAEKMRAEAALADAEDLSIREWLSACENLERLEQHALRLKQTLKDQSRRSDLEERRYSIGRASIINVIQAGDDLTAAEINFNLATSQMHQMGWDILRQHDGFRSAISEWAQTPLALRN